MNVCEYSVVVEIHMKCTYTLLNLRTVRCAYYASR